MDRHLVRKISSGFIIATIAVWILWDIPAAVLSGTYGTLSDVIRHWATQHPAFGFSIGILAGHWFWNAKDVVYPFLMYVAWGLIAVLLTLDLGFGVLPALYPLWPFIFGIGMGRLLWPMEASVLE